MRKLQRAKKTIPPFKSEAEEPTWSVQLSCV